MNKNRLKLLAKIFIAVVLLYYLVDYVNYEEIIIALKKSDKQLIILVFLLSFLNIYLQFIKWKVVCNSLIGVFDDNKIWLSLFYGFSGGIATPIRIGEYVGRKLPFENTTLMKVSIATMIEKFASLFLVLIIGGIGGAIFLSKYYTIALAIPILLSITGFVIAILALSKGVKFLRIFLNQLRNKFPFFQNLFMELKYAKELGKESLRKLLTFSLLFYFVYILQYALLVLAFNNGGDFFSAIWAGTIVMFAKSFLSFISFADLGIRESASVFVLSKIGLSKAVGFNSAIFLFLFNLLIPSIIGLFLLIKKDK
ncbi:MAG: flippase-like domain-containing protein [Ignavibacteriae bacterium]|nr:flippase-like domain-containing protein [Ignavibacteriota bacterium]